MYQISNGKKTLLLSDAQMSWYIHVSCRNLNRPGWAYLTEFADANTQNTKPNFQKIFAVKLDTKAINNAPTETYAHVHHSDYIDYEWSPFGVPSRDGSKVMFRSDWMVGGSGEVDSYIAYIPIPTAFENVNQNLSFSLHPNPAKTELYLIGKGLENANYQITSIEGKALQSGIVQGSIAIETLKVGTYIIKIKTDEGEKVQRFVKQ